MLRNSLLFTLFIFICCEMVGPVHAAARRPNFVVIISDDQGWNDIGYHNRNIKTPTLDRLAAEGTRFENFYVWPTCSPTRVGLLTGRAPSRFDVLGPIGGKSRQTLPDGVATLPRVLAEHGYRTFMSGKWHLGLRPESGPQKFGFQSSYGYLHGQIDPYTHRYKFGDKTWHRDGKFLKETGHVTDLISSEAVRIIQQTGDRPFFLYVAYSVPHYPLNEPEQWTRPYEGSIQDHWRKQFAASVSHMDAGIGRIVQALEESGQRENTILIYLSDNGGQKSWGSTREYEGRYPRHTTLGSNLPLRGWKVDLYEGGIRVPAFVNVPDKLCDQQLKTIELPISVLDIFPSLLQWAGVKPQAEWKLEGQSLTQLLQSEKPTNLAKPRSFYWKTRNAFAIRRGHWKLIETLRKGKGSRLELFNLKDDPNEKDECSQRHEKLVEELLLELEAHKKRDGKATLTP